MPSPSTAATWWSDVPPLPAHYHVAVIVPDLRAARARFTELLGVRWGPVMHMAEVEYRDGAGHDLLLPTTISFTVGHPSIELIEETPGTVWVRNEHSNLHHLGFWTDDFPEATASLGASGCPLQVCGRAGDDAPVTFAYHGLDDFGVRVELVDASMRDAMSFLFEPDPAGG
jgi:catechol 2,3-dioxygenase-like lactoylglutathione lyase family enzyme